MSGFHIVPCSPNKLWQGFRDITSSIKGLVYWGLTPHQQPGSYRSGDYDDDDENVWWRKPDYPEWVSEWVVV